MKTVNGEFRRNALTGIGKFPTAFAEYLWSSSLDGGCATWGDSTEGPGHVTWVGGRHVIVESPSGAIAHVKLPHWDGWNWTDRPVNPFTVTGAYVWSWIEDCLPDVAAWEFNDDEDEGF
jgi:hypothetical protein